MVATNQKPACKTGAREARPQQQAVPAPAKPLQQKGSFPKARGKAKQMQRQSLWHQTQIKLRLNQSRKSHGSSSTPFQYPLRARQQNQRNSCNPSRKQRPQRVLKVQPENNSWNEASKTIKDTDKAQLEKLENSSTTRQKNRILKEKKNMQPDPHHYRYKPLLQVPDKTKNSKPSLMTNLKPLVSSMKTWWNKSRR